MSSEKREKDILDSCLGKSQNLNSLIDYSNDSIVSKTIFNKPSGTVTLFAFDKGQKLSEHTSPFDAIVQIIDGTGELTIAGQKLEAKAGEIVIMPANIAHDVKAGEKFKMLLTMIRD